MKTASRKAGYQSGVFADRASKSRSGLMASLAMLTACAALALPGAALAKKATAAAAGCVVFPPAYVDTGYPFSIKIVRDPSYTGVWSQPIVEATAQFTGTDGGKVTSTYTETTSRYGYGVTYVNATLLAPSCNGMPCAIDTSVDATVTAVVKEPLNKGNQFRETVCTPATVSVNPAQ